MSGGDATVLCEPRARALHVRFVLEWVVKLSWWRCLCVRLVGDGLVLIGLFGVRPVRYPAFLRRRSSIDRHHDEERVRPPYLPLCMITTRKVPGYPEA